MHVLLLTSVELTAFSAVALIMVVTMLRPSREARRVFQLSRIMWVPDRPAKRAVLHKGLSLLHVMRTRLGLRENEKLRQRLIAAGHNDPGNIDLYFGLQLLGPLAAVLVASFIRDNMVAWMIGLALGAYFLPDMVLTEMIRRRREKIRLGLPDAIDLLVVCVEAGLGLDQALQRTAQELAISHAVISEEFTQINLEQRAGKARLEAWTSMAERTKLDIVRSFTSMLEQTDRFGTPIVRALTTFSDGLRLKRRQQAEELAAKTTVKLVFPLVLFIFPSIFIVLLGPAIITIMRDLNGAFK